MAKRNVGLKLQATNALIAKLTPARQTYWQRVLREMQKRASKQAVGADAAATEWDLSLANWLDRVYTSVATEATKTRKELIDATADATGTIGWGMWPLALAALAIGIAVSKGRGR